MKVPCQHCAQPMEFYASNCPHCTHGNPESSVQDVIYWIIAAFIIYVLFSAFG